MINSNRPRRRLRRAALVSLALLALPVAAYLWYGVKVWFGVPTLSRDYAAEMRAAAEAIPEDQRAWPLLREAVMGIERAPRVHEPHPTWSENWIELLRLRPHHQNWPRLVEYLGCHEEQLALIRLAAERPRLGFTEAGRPDDELNARLLGMSTDEVRAQLTEPERTGALGSPAAVWFRTVWRSPEGQAFSALSDAQEVLVADMRLAAHQHDPARFVANARAHRRLAWLSRDLLTGYMWARVWSDAVGEALNNSLMEFDDDQLRVLQEAMSLDNPRVIAAESLEAQRRQFLGLVDAVYTDGPVTGGVVQPQILWLDWWTRDPGEYGVRDALAELQLSWAGRPLMAAVFPSRAEALRRFKHNFDRIQANDALPIWVRQRIDLPEWERNEWEEVADGVFRRGERPLPLSFVRRYGEHFPNEYVHSNAWWIENAGSRRDGVVVGIALERFRRAHGDYPYALSDLVPEYLESVPVDIFDGRPLRFMMAGPDSPVVYSVGTDRANDGGRLPMGYEYDSDHERNNRAAQWRTPEEQAERRAKDPDDFDARNSGDWILWPVLPEDWRR